MIYDPEEFNGYFRLFTISSYNPDSQCSDWQLFTSPEATELLRNKAASYGGLISMSHFIRAFQELRASGEIQQLRSPQPAEKAFTLSAEEYRRLPASQVVRRYRQDHEFKRAVDALVTAGEI